MTYSAVPSNLLITKREKLPYVCAKAIVNCHNNRMLAENQINKTTKR